MKLYKTTITPTSNFATSLKGDTLFGQICWAIRYKYGEKRLKELLSTYKEKPFLVVSDAFVSGYLPKPSLPSILLGENSEYKKQNRKKVWLTLEELQKAEFTKARDDKEVNGGDTSYTVMRNSINYKTFTTDDSGVFAPYGQSELSLSSKDIYFLISDDFTLDELQGSFELVSQMGYGKDASIGKGRFECNAFEEVSLISDTTTFMTLSPFSPTSLECEDIYYEPFTRFGKHGASLANSSPFKTPLLLANSGAVVKFANICDIQYIGETIQGHSTHSDTIHQGYSIVIPIRGGKDENL